MQILVDFEVNKSFEAALIGDNTIYRPDLSSKSDSIKARTLSALLPNALITKTLPGLNVVENWSKKTTNYPVFIIHIGDEVQEQDFIGNVPVHYVSKSKCKDAEIKAFVLAERIHSHNLDLLSNESLLAKRRMIEDRSNESTVMVGAGIVNLISAYYLNKDGYALSVYEASPDPREESNWTFFGCTYGGEDARMFSLSESRQHFARYHDNEDDVGEIFRTSIPEDGWLCAKEENISENTESWIQELEKTPVWLSEIINEDIISFNQESQPLWYDMIQDTPELFEDVGFRPNVMRIYSTREQLHSAIIKEGKIGSIKRILDAETIAREYPALAPSVNNGDIFGGIEIVGFTLSVHKFAKKIIQYLEAQGVEFNWNSEIDEIYTDVKGNVTGLLCDEKTITAKNYVICPGAYGNKLLSSTAADNLIGGMLGAWMRLPDINPALDVSLKITRNGFASQHSSEGANVITGQDEEGENVLYIGSGHGFIGEHPRTIDSEEVQHLLRVVEETAKRYFPQQYEEAKRRDKFALKPRWCIRPWTPSGLGIFEMKEAVDSGMLVITGGHNTGGFAHAPSVAMAVLSALSGKKHKMHHAYHPRRISDFIDGRSFVISQEQISDYTSNDVVLPMGT